MPVVALPYLKACCLHPANVCGWLLCLKAASKCNPVGCGREPRCSCRGEKPAACPRGSSVVGWIIRVDEVRAGRWGPRSSSCASSCCLHHSCSSPSPPLSFTSAFHLAELFAAFGFELPLGVADAAERTGSPCLSGDLLFPPAFRTRCGPAWWLEVDWPPSEELVLVERVADASS